MEETVGSAGLAVQAGVAASVDDRRSGETPFTFLTKNEGRTRTRVRIARATIRVRHRRSGDQRLRAPGRPRNRLASRLPLRPTYLFRERRVVDLPQRLGTSL